MRAANEQSNNDSIGDDEVHQTGWKFDTESMDNHTPQFLISMELTGK